MKRLPTNRVVADMLDRIADLLDAKAENPFRVRSYRTVAEAVRAESGLVSRRVRTGGAEGLRGIRGIGEKLASLIAEFVETGSSELLKTLESETHVPASADQTDRQRSRDVRRSRPATNPSIAVRLILDIDREYREKAKLGVLKLIAPKKLNPEGKAWLPIMAVARRGWKFTVMFSNTRTAHELGKTGDWVVVYYAKEAAEEQCTVVTEHRGVLQGRRVIRGREAECKTLYGAR